MKVSDLFPDRDAGKTVKMPQRLSAGIWHGLLKEILEESGTTPARAGKNGPIAARDWTKYTVVTADDRAFVTFSSTEALLARCALAGDMKCEIQWEVDGYGSHKILCIDEAPKPEGEKP